MGRPGRSRCALCGMGKRAGITSLCPSCNQPVCARHLTTVGSEMICKRCSRMRKESERAAVERAPVGP